LLSRALHALSRLVHDFERKRGVCRARKAPKVMKKGKSYYPESVSFSPGSHFLRLISKLNTVDVPFSEEFPKSNVSKYFLVIVDYLGTVILISGINLALVLLEFEGLSKSMASVKNLSL
jgi:hypothetical protein